MSATIRRAIAGLGVVALAASAVACSATTPSPSAPAPGTSSEPPANSAPVHVDLTVVGLLPGATPEAQENLANQVKLFEAANPDITVTTKEYEWKATTFAADLAGSTLPDVFEIPFTDAKALIANGQISDMNDYLTEFPFGGAFNPNVLQYGQGADGHAYAIPAKSVYGIGLHYNRELFTKAGLDPDKPPTTWDEVRSYAKQIADKTGAAGYSQMATNNTGGWQLTVATYARGGRMETVGTDGKATATVDNDATKAALQFLKDLRWADNAMGSNFTYDWGSINQAFAAGQVGMYTSGQDVYTSLVQANAINPDIYGLTMIPLEGTDAGILGGGTMAAVKAGVSDDVKLAAAKWISHWYLSRYTSEEAALAFNQQAFDDKQPVGTPELPIFSDENLAQYRAWIKPLINVPLDQMTGFTDKIGSATILNEPAVATQDVYAALDPAVQAVLTDKNADINALLADATKTAQRAINKAQR
ncbi:MAG: extracellular solute-binding protein [Propionicimonas sp.]|uniref:ABC transporter substrate-binding protein n=1 Tax=Propionicimonas sp. TaxID=1955623 RepID=UPI002B1F03DB|nr:extracellular solute-binding protein [Propionicimonas sp.]MEA4943220.1 extracellular solute-binding protein [Propionicimonas sp.]